MDKVKTENHTQLIGILPLELNIHSKNKNKIRTESL